MKKYTPNFPLKYQFPGFENIKENYSQTFQDMFVLIMLNGKRNGTFLEIGAQDPIELSNTYLLESVFGWRGISIEIDEVHANLHKLKRTNTFILGDALKIDYTELLSNCPKQIDYLQIDIDDPSLDCLIRLPLTDYRFSVITFEHDAYKSDHGSYVRTVSRRIFQQHNYEMIAGNISNTTHNDVYEDWWVDPAVVDPKLIEIFRRGENANIPGDEFLQA
jgi:hypothetical protein